MRSAPRVLALAASLLLSTRCSGARAADPVAKGPPAEARSYTLQNGVLHVELKIPNAPAGGKPAILSPFGDLDALLARGVILVQYQVDWPRLRELFGGSSEPPAEPETGQRVGAWLLSSPRPGVIGRNYFALVNGNAKFVGGVLDLLERLPEVDPQRIAIAGSSTQGFVALEALRREPRLAAGVIRVACGDYFTFLRSSTLALANDPRWLPDGHLPLDADYAEQLRLQEPNGAPEAYPPRPLLLLAGQDDPVMPFPCVENTASAFAPAYARAGVPERFHLEVFPGEGHDLGAGADRAALGWWEHWLLAAPPVSGRAAAGAPPETRRGG
jgi:hypothetical protein